MPSGQFHRHEDPRRTALHQQGHEVLRVLHDRAQFLDVAHGSAVGRQHDVTRLDASSDGLTLQFMKNPPVDPVKILLLVQSRAGLKLAGPDRLKLQKPLPDLEAKTSAAQSLLEELKTP